MATASRLRCSAAASTSFTRANTRARRTHLRARRARQRVSAGHAAAVSRTFRSAIGSSAGSRSGSWSSRRLRGVGRSLPQSLRWTRVGRCWRFPAMSWAAATTAPTRCYGTVQSLWSVRTISWRSCLCALGTRDQGLAAAKNPRGRIPRLRIQCSGRWMRARAYDLEELAERSGIDRVSLLPRLIELELAGAVQRVEGGRFVRFRRTVLRYSTGSHG